MVCGVGCEARQVVGCGGDASYRGRGPCGEVGDCGVAKYEIEACEEVVERGVDSPGERSGVYAVAGECCQHCVDRRAGALLRTRHKLNFRQEITRCTSARECVILIAAAIGLAYAIERAACIACCCWEREVDEEVAASVLERCVEIYDHTVCSVGGEGASVYAGERGSGPRGRVGIGDYCHTHIECSVLPVTGTARGDEILELLDGLTLKCREHACRIYGLGTLNIVAVESIYWYVAVCCGAISYGQERHIGAVQSEVGGCLGAREPAASAAAAIGADVDVVGGVAREAGGEVACLAAGEAYDGACVGAGVGEWRGGDDELVGGDGRDGLRPGDEHGGARHAVESEVGGRGAGLYIDRHCPEAACRGVLGVEHVGERGAEVVARGAADLCEAVDDSLGACSVECEGGAEAYGLCAIGHGDGDGTVGSVDNATAYLGTRGCGDGVGCEVDLVAECCTRNEGSPSAVCGGAADGAEAEGVAGGWTEACDGGCCGASDGVGDGGHAVGVVELPRALFAVLAAAPREGGGGGCYGGEGEVDGYGAAFGRGEGGVEPRAHPFAVAVVGEVEVVGGVAVEAGEVQCGGSEARNCGGVDRELAVAFLRSREDIGEVVVLRVVGVVVPRDGGGGAACDSGGEVGGAHAVCLGAECKFGPSGGAVIYGVVADRTHVEIVVGVGAEAGYGVACGVDVAVVGSEACEVGDRGAVDDDVEACEVVVLSGVDEPRDLRRGGCDGVEHEGVHRRAGVFMGAGDYGETGVDTVH